MEFTAWFATQQSVKKEVIALDGKRIKGSRVHLLHVFATSLGIVLAQADVENKNNESVEVPAILDNLDVSGTVITADALNCQKAILLIGQILTIMKKRIKDMGVLSSGSAGVRKILNG